MEQLTDRQREGLRLMRDDMRHQHLEVIAVPAPEAKHSGHMVRQVINQNPEWYRAFCEAYPKQRTKPRTKGKPDTKIVRKTFLRDLDKWINRGSTRSTYKEHLLNIAEGRVQDEEEWLREQDSRYGFSEADEQTVDDDEVPF